MEKKATETTDGERGALNWVSAAMSIYAEQRSIRESHASSALAAELGTSTRSVQRWRKFGFVGTSRCAIALSKLTGVPLERLLVPE